MDFPSWLTEALQKRLEAISLDMKQDDLIRMECAGFDVVFRLFLRSLSIEKRTQFLQLEELWTRLEGLEKEWIYKQGDEGWDTMDTSNSKIKFGLFYLLLACFLISIDISSWPVWNTILLFLHISSSLVASSGS
jgi:hypothetical protein